MPHEDRRLSARVESLLIGADVAPGDRLPTERALAELLDAPRGAVRRVLDRLEADGIISRHVGRGTFLERPLTMNSAMGHGDTSPTQIMQARLVVEPAMSALAAKVATPLRLEYLDERFDVAQRASDFAAWESADAALHRGIALACDNALILSMFDVVNESRTLPVWGTLKQRVTTEERRAVYQEDHRAIIDALYDRNPEQAHAAMTRHLQVITEHLLGQR